MANYESSGKTNNERSGGGDRNKDKDAEEELKECHGELLMFSNQLGGRRRENSIIGMSSGEEDEEYRPYEEADSFYR